jgi:hypothetical protein
LLVTATGYREARTAARLLVAAAEQLPSGSSLSWSIDVDPLDLG